MKSTLKILALVLGVTLITLMQSQGQNLPSVCVGGTIKYGVHGLNGSLFTWKITDPDGIVLPASAYLVYGNGDSIQIEWKNTYKEGIYDLDVDEVTLYGCTGTAPTQHVVLNSSTINIPFAGVPTSVAICYGGQAALDPGLFSSYLWQDRSTNRIFYTGETGTYQVRLVDNNHSCSYNKIEAIIRPLPLIWLGNDTVLFGNQTLTLDAYNSNFDFYEWSTGGIASTQIVDGQSGNQSVWVKVTDLYGCKNSDTINISAADYSKLRIPAAFTPNGDGINDKWYFPAPDLTQQDLYPYFEDVTVSIFNRWGKMVWEANKDFKAWDGKDLGGRELPMDSYHFIIRFKVGEKTYMYKGSITIIR